MIFSKTAVKLCGVPVTATYGAAAPATWGANVTVNSYNGELRIFAVTDKETINSAAMLANLVRTALVEACKSDEKSKSWVDTEIDRIRNEREEELFQARLRLGMLNKGEVVYQFPHGRNGRRHLEDPSR